MSSTTVDDHDRKRKSVKKTIHPKGIIIPFYPRLAAQIGFNDSLLLIQIDFWIHNLRVKVEEFEGVKWLNLSAQEMIERGFEHLSRQKINKTIERLVERGLLRVNYLPGSRTKWLTLDYEKIDALGVQAGDPVTQQSSSSTKPLTPAQRRRAMASLANRIKQEQKKNEQSRRSEHTDLLDY